MCAHRLPMTYNFHFYHLIPPSLFLSFVLRKLIVSVCLFIWNFNCPCHHTKLWLQPQLHESCSLTWSKVNKLKKSKFGSKKDIWYYFIVHPSIDWLLNQRGSPENLLSSMFAVFSSYSVCHWSRIMDPMLWIGQFPHEIEKQFLSSMDTW